MKAALHIRIPILDEVLNGHAAELAGDFRGYRNHAYRVANICAAISSPDAESMQKIAVAAAFHDIGIWTERTFDYIQPSIDAAHTHLAACSCSPWTPEIETMIREHHKLRSYKNNPAWLVESFRRADLVDVSMGVFKFGLPSAYLSQLFVEWPSAGFHGRLVQLSLARARSHPWNPLPMLHW